MPAENAANMDFDNYTALWKTVSLGLVKEVDASGLKLIKREKKVGKVGVKIDDVVAGFEGTIKTVLHQVDKTVWQQLCPWWTSGTVAAVPPTRGYSQYANAGLLRLHPVTAADATHDLCFTKAFPNVVAAKGDGENWRELVVEWDVYMDQTALLGSNQIAGVYVGDPP